MPQVHFATDDMTQIKDRIIVEGLNYLISYRKYYRYN
jgi:hypothetical protein